MLNSDNFVTNRANDLNYYSSFLEMIFQGLF